MNQNLQDRLADAAKTVKEDKLGTALAAKLTKQLAGQDDRLNAVEKRLKDLAWENRRGGGFPWGLLVWLGGAYAAYRFVPTVQQQVDSLLGRIDPGVKGNLNRAGDAVKDAVQAGLKGDDLSGPAEAALREMQRAGEKTIDATGKKLDDLKKD